MPGFFCLGITILGKGDFEGGSPWLGIVKRPRSTGPNGAGLACTSRTIGFPGKDKGVEVVRKSDCYLL